MVFKTCVCSIPGATGVQGHPGATGVPGATGLFRIGSFTLVMFFALIKIPFQYKKLCFSAYGAREALCQSTSCKLVHDCRYKLHTTTHTPV